MGNAGRFKEAERMINEALTPAAEHFSSVDGDLGDRLSLLATGAQKQLEAQQARAQERQRLLEQKTAAEEKVRAEQARADLEYKRAQTQHERAEMAEKLM